MAVFNHSAGVARADDAAYSFRQLSQGVHPNFQRVVSGLRYLSLEMQESEVSRDALDEAYTVLLAVATAYAMRHQAEGRIKALHLLQVVTDYADSVKGA
ncbi:hypothetical protein FAZ69_32905 [Trinickia terrae]|uniref:Uncharacterized protein n=2 Tax=Trinickia terrae TaxID=2571161 RepID=A0A4U1H991_9BURK|nr:hypothetical protein FAZ69_32905 [Trinickia terrae]